MKSWWSKLKSPTLAILAAFGLVLGTTLASYSAISQLAGLAVAQSATQWNSVKDAAVGDGLTSGILASGMMIFNGLTFDRLRGDSTNGLDVDVTRAQNIIPGTGATNLGKAEDTVAASGDTGVEILGIREDTPSATAANGDYIGVKTNQYGHQFIASVCNDPTLTQSVAINQTGLNGNAELVALTGGQTIYVCGFNFVSSGTANIRLVYGTGSACATGETSITGAYPLIANTGIAVSNGGAIQAKTAVSNALCIETSAAVDVRGLATYAKF